MKQSLTPPKIPGSGILLAFIPPMEDGQSRPLPLHWFQLLSQFIAPGIQSPNMPAQTSSNLQRGPFEDFSKATARWLFFVNAARRNVLRRAACRRCRNTDTWLHPNAPRPGKPWGDCSRFSYRLLDWGRTRPPGRSGPSPATRLACSSWLDQCQPMRVFVVAPVNDVKKRALDFFGDRAARSTAQRDAIQFPDRGDFGGGTGKKSFV